MKKLLLIFVIALASISTSFSQRSNIKKDIKMYSNVWDEIINKGSLDLINDKNFDSYITLVTSPENVVGIENFKAYYSNFVNGFSEVKFTIIDVFGQGDKIVKHWNFIGKHTGDFFGIPASGRSVNIDGVTLVKMKNGKIAQEQDFMDNMVFLQQLGILSNPENVNIIDSAYKAFAVGDIPSVLEFLDANVIWNEAEDKAEIIVCSDNFHGRTISIISFSTEPLYRKDFGPFTPGFVVIPFWK